MIDSTNPRIIADNIREIGDTFDTVNNKFGSVDEAIGFLADTGVKNLITTPSITTNGEYQAVTFTDDGNGTISTSGTASDDYTYVYSRRTASGKLILPNGKYIFSGCTGGSKTTYYISLRTTKNSDSYTYAELTDGELEFEVDGDDTFTDKAHVGIYIVVKKNAVMTGKSFPIMIRPASIENNAFQVPAKTNNQLTSEVNSLLCKQTDADTYMLTATVDAQGAITYAWVPTT